MQQYQEFIKKQLEEQELLKKIDMECIRCPKCQSQWFEEVTLQKFKADHNVILGQHVPPKPGSIPYYVLKCARCGDLLEPRIIHNTRDLGGNDYDDLLDTLEGKGDTREEKVVVNLEELVKGLQERIQLLESAATKKPNKKVGNKQDSVAPNPHIKRKKLEVPSEEL